MDENKEKSWEKYLTQDQKEFRKVNENLKKESLGSFDWKVKRGGGWEAAVERIKNKEADDMKEKDNQEKSNNLEFETKPESSEEPDLELSNDDKIHRYELVESKLRDQIAEGKPAILDGNEYTPEQAQEIIDAARNEITRLRNPSLDQLPEDTPANLEGEPSSETTVSDYEEKMARLEKQMGVSRNNEVSLGVFTKNESDINGSLIERLRGLSENEQLKIVRSKLDLIDTVEASTSMEFGTANDARQLDALVESGVVPLEISREIEARLSLHDCGVLMRRADGKIKMERKEGEEAPINNVTIERAVQTVFGNGRQLNGERLKTILEPGKMKDYEVGYAWDILQKINFERDSNGDYIGYSEWIKRANRELGKNFPIKATQWVESEEAFGDTNTNFFKDNKADRHGAVQKLIVNDIAEKIKLSLSRDRKNDLGLVNSEEESKYANQIAQKSFKMAEKAFWATLESSALNRELNIGPDQLAECMGFRFSRKAALRKNQLAGPLIHVDKIEGFGNSYIRSFLNKDDYEPLYLADIRNVGYEKLDPNSYQTYAARTLSFNEMRQLLLDRNIDKSKLLDPNKAWYRKVNGYITRTDPNGGKNLEFWLIAGILDIELNAEGARDVGDQWTSGDLKKLEIYSTEALDPNDPNSGFLTKKQWINITTEAVGYYGLAKHTENTKRGFIRGLLGKKR